MAVASQVAIAFVSMVESESLSVCGACFRGKCERFEMLHYETALLYWLLLWSGGVVNAQQ
jgi:uncharacterized UBP type Zn finger protein